MEALGPSNEDADKFKSQLGRKMSKALGKREEALAEKG